MTGVRTFEEAKLEQAVELAERNVELSEKVEDLERQLKQTKLDLEAAQDSAQLLSDRLKQVQQLNKALEHSGEQWRKTAFANERLHNEANTEAQLLRGKLAMMGQK